MMNTKEFFLKVLDQETQTFRKVLEALPDDKFGHKVHIKSREAGNIAAQLALQWKAITGVLKTGTPTMDPHDMENMNKPKMLEAFDAGMAELKQAVKDTADDDWENGMGRLEWPGGKWEAPKYDMAWGFFLDAVHHRGQLTTFLRAMGEKVPGVYGPSADSA